MADGLAEVLSEVLPEVFAEVFAEVLLKMVPEVLSGVLVDLSAGTVVRIVTKCNPVPVPPVDPRTVLLLPSPNGADDN